MAPQETFLSASSMPLPLPAPVFIVVKFFPFNLLMLPSEHPRCWPPRLTTQSPATPAICSGVTHVSAQQDAAKLKRNLAPELVLSEGRREAATHRETNRRTNLPLAERVGGEGIAAPGWGTARTRSDVSRHPWENGLHAARCSPEPAVSNLGWFGMFLLMLRTQWTSFGSGADSVGY